MYTERNKITSVPALITALRTGPVYVDGVISLAGVVRSWTVYRAENEVKAGRVNYAQHVNRPCDAHLQGAINAD